MLGWACVILVLTSWPGSPGPDHSIPGLDKLAHFGVYFVLGLLTWRALSAPRPRTAILSAFGAIALFGILDELHQLYVPYREASVFDWSADLLGAALGLRLAIQLLPRIPVLRDLTT